jgi:hypothetical protein
VRPFDAPGVNGTYNLDLFAADAVMRIEKHAAAQLLKRQAGEKENGLYIYAAFHSVHASVCPANVQFYSKPRGGKPGVPWAIKACTQTLHAPCHEVDSLYGSVTDDTYKVMGGMLTYLDYGRRQCYSSTGQSRAAVPPRFVLR